MLVKVGVPQSMKYTEMNDTEVFVQDNQEVKLDSSNDIRSFLVIALHNPDESLKLHPRYSFCLHQPTN